MTDLPATPGARMALVTDLDICIGCHACETACKAWTDRDAPAPGGAWPLRLTAFEVTPPTGPAQIVHAPKSCLHCDDAPCVTICPTGASFKRAADGLVLVDPDTCTGCGLCALACPYGAREADPVAGVMRTCTACEGRGEGGAPAPACVEVCPTGARHFGDLGDPGSAISALMADRGLPPPLPGRGAAPVGGHLAPRPRDEVDVLAPLLAPVDQGPGGFLGWLDRTLERL